MCQEGIHLKDELEACFIELPSVLPKIQIAFLYIQACKNTKNICDKQIILRSNLADSEFQCAILAY